MTSARRRSSSPSTPTGTPAGVSQLQVGDKLECGVDGVGKLAVTIGKPE